MAEHHERQPQGGSFWRSRIGITFLAFLGVAAVLLGWEHRVHLLTGYAGTVLLLAGCVVMHFYMHRGNGGHGGGGGK